MGRRRMCIWEQRAFLLAFLCVLTWGTAIRAVGLVRSPYSDAVEEIRASLDRTEVLVDAQSDIANEIESLRTRVLELESRYGW